MSRASSHRPRATLARGVAALAIAAGVAVAAADATSSAKVPTAAVETPAACPARPPATIAPENWAPARQQLAPSGVAALRVCRYSGLNSHPPLALVASALVQTATTTRSIVSELDRLPSLRGLIACPMDDGSEILLLLAYPVGRRVEVSIGLTGCALVSNGSVHRTAAALGSQPTLGSQLVRRLELIATETRSGSLSPPAATAVRHRR